MYCMKKDTASILGIIIILLVVACVGLITTIKESSDEHAQEVEELKSELEDLNYEINSQNIKLGPQPSYKMESYAGYEWNSSNKVIVKNLSFDGECFEMLVHIPSKNIGDKLYGDGYITTDNEGDPCYDLEASYNSYGYDIDVIIPETHIKTPPGLLTFLYTFYDENDKERCFVVNLTSLKYKSN